MKYKKMTGFFLVLVFMTALLLSGCRNEGKESGEKEEAQATEDTGKETVLMAVGEETVSIDEAKIYVYFLKNQYEPGIGDIIWSYKLEGKTFEEYAKGQIQNLLTELKVLKQVAAKEDISLSNDELEEARGYAVDFLQKVPKEDAQKYGITQAALTKIYSENILANKVFEITTNDVDTNIPDEDVKQITIQNLMVMTKGTDKNGIKIDMTKEEKKQAKKKAKNLLKEARETTGFLAFAESNTDAPQVEMTFSVNDAPEEIKEEAFSLKSGEMSGLINGENGYYIIYCVNDDDEDATAQRKEQLILERQMKSFEEKFESWSGEYEVVVSTTLWDEIAF